MRIALFATCLGDILFPDVPRRPPRCPPPLNGWTAARDLPDLPAETFRDWWTRTHEGPRP